MKTTAEKIATLRNGLPVNLSDDDCDLIEAEFPEMADRLRTWPNPFSTGKGNKYTGQLSPIRN